MTASVSTPETVPAHGFLSRGEFVPWLSIEGGREIWRTHLREAVAAPEWPCDCCGGECQVGRIVYAFPAGHAAAIWAHRRCWEAGHE